MKKKIIVGITICISIAVIITGMVWGIRIYRREQDPNWQIAKKLYNVESALQEIDESGNCNPLPKSHHTVIRTPMEIPLPITAVSLPMWAMSLPRILGLTNLHWNRS